MEWEDRSESENVEDQRGFRPGGIAIGGGAGLLLLLVALFLGVDPRRLLDVAGQQEPGAAQQAPHNPSPEEERLAHFTKVIFGDTERVWDNLFRRMGRQYEKPTLVLYTGQVQSGCGFTDAQVGPFYCPMDSKVYIDLSFYADMQRKLNAPGEFARAYVVAHEVGHHVQRLLGYSKEEGRGSRNERSVRLELQADYFAGVWAHHAQEQFRHFLDPGDLRTALNAAFQIGDDRLQRQARGYVVPDSFTHGTSKQRERWFLQGFKTGDVDAARELFELPYNQL